MPRAIAVPRAVAWFAFHQAMSTMGCVVVKVLSLTGLIQCVPCDQSSCGGWCQSRLLRAIHSLLLLGAQTPAHAGVIRSDDFRRTGRLRQRGRGGWEPPLCLAPPGRRRQGFRRSLVGREERRAEGRGASMERGDGAEGAEDEESSWRRRRTGEEETKTKKKKTFGCRSPVVLQ